jgi:carbamoyltransferase
MYILGISAYYHDAAAVLLKDGELIAAVQEERFSRIKNDASFPIQSIQYCLNVANITSQNLSAITFYDKPFLKFERILETFLAVAPKGFLPFITMMPIWLKEKLFLKSILKKELQKIGDFDWTNTKLLFTEHHLSHAASTFFTSPFQEAAVVTIDGVGEWATTSISYGKDNQITVVKEIRFPHSLGLLYSSFTHFLGFKVNSDEYKVMGLAPYAAKESVEVQNYYRLIKTNLVTINHDGSYSLQMKNFSFHKALTMFNNKTWESIFGIPKRSEHEALTNAHASLAQALQLVTEEIVVGLCQQAASLTGSKNICLSGGVALNCVANGSLERASIFNHVFVQPAAGDAGGALGAALATYFIFFEKERVANNNFHPYLGYEINALELEQFCIGKELVTSINEEAILMKQIAHELANGKIVGWIQGRMEWGPRALGNRSILASPLCPDMQQKINQKIKRREGFRPFAPVIIEEDASAYFDMKNPSPWMMKTFPIATQHRNNRPASFEHYSISEKLNYPLSTMPAITHVDFSARVQTVNAEQNHKLYLLLQAFKKETNYPVLVNTSFNVRDEPIVMTAQQAFDCFNNTEMDLLVIGNKVFRK